MCNSCNYRSDFMQYLFIRTGKRMLQNNCPDLFGGARENSNVLRTFDIECGNYCHSQANGSTATE